MDSPETHHDPGQVRPFRAEDIVIITGSAYPVFAQGVAQLLQVECDASSRQFANGETGVQIKPNLRRRDTFIVQSTVPPDQDRHFMEIFLLAAAARRASAGEISAVLPFMAYQRQDRKESPRVPISASVLPNLLVAAGVDRLITMDNHSAQQQGYIANPWDELYASYSLAPAIRELKLVNPVVLSPDVGGMKRADYYLHVLGAQDLAAVYKRRKKVSGSSESVMLVGDVSGKDVLLVDDITSRGDTLFSAAKLAKKNGANRIVAAVAHGLFLGNFLKELDNSPIEKVLVTNSLPHREELQIHPKIVIVDIQPLIAEAIKRTITGQSLNSALFPKFDETI